MAAILLLEYAAADSSRRREVRERVAALALLDSARIVFAAVDEASAREVLALAFSDGRNAEDALARWTAEGAVPAGSTMRKLDCMPVTTVEAPILLFP